MSGTEDKVTLPPDSVGKAQRERKLTVAGQTVYEDVVALDDGNGNLLDPRQVRALTSADVVTANAGQNLNTSALALEAGNLATILATLQKQIILPNGAILLKSYGVGIPDLTGLVGLNGPRDAFELANGNWLITDMLNHRVIEVNPNTKTIVWQYGTTDVPGNGANQLSSPYSAVRMPNGDTLIADCGNNRIIEVTPQNTIAVSLTGADLSIANIYPTSVQYTDENNVVFGNTASYPHVLEVAWPAKTLVKDWSTNANPAFSWPTYAHKVQGSEVTDVTDFYNYHHMLVVDFNLGEFYNFNADGSLLFATARYCPFGSGEVAGKGVLECVDMWGDRNALLTASQAGCLIAYIKAEDLTSLTLLFGTPRVPGNRLGRAYPFLNDTGYCHRTPDGNLLVSNYAGNTVFKVLAYVNKLITPSPLNLWVNQSITDTTNGSTTPPFATVGADKKTIYIISTQAGTLNIQALDEVALNFKTIASMAVAANTLTPYMTTYGAREMAINFVPTVSAGTSCWVVLE